jgi:hypothetical protein
MTINLLHINYFRANEEGKIRQKAVAIPFMLTAGSKTGQALNRVSGN